MPNACRGRPYFVEVAGQTRRLYRMLDALDERLIDRLDDALNADDPEVRSRLHRDARAIVDEYIDFMNGDPLLREIDDNPFTKVAVRSRLEDTLGDLQRKLAV